MGYGEAVGSTGQPAQPPPGLGSSIPWTHATLGQGQCPDGHTGPYGSLMLDPSRPHRQELLACSGDQHSLGGNGDPGA